MGPLHEHRQRNADRQQVEDTEHRITRIKGTSLELESSRRTPPPIILLPTLASRQVFEWIDSPGPYPEMTRPGQRARVAEDGRSGQWW